MTFCANFSRLSESGLAVKPKCDFFYISPSLFDCHSEAEFYGVPASREPPKPVRTAQRIKYPDADKTARSTQLLNFPNSTAVAWVWNPASPDIQTNGRDQTLGLRSVVPLASSSLTARATQSCRGAKQYSSYWFSIPRNAFVGKPEQPHSPRSN